MAVEKVREVAVEKVREVAEAVVETEAEAVLVEPLDVRVSRVGRELGRLLLLRLLDEVRSEHARAQLHERADDQHHRRDRGPHAAAARAELEGASEHRRHDEDEHGREPDAHRAAVQF